MKTSDSRAAILCGRRYLFSFKPLVINRIELVQEPKSCEYSQAARSGAVWGVGGVEVISCDANF